MKKTTILMLGGGRRVSIAEALIDAGKRLGTDVKIIGYELDINTPLALVGKIEKGLKWDNPGVVEDIVRIATEYEADIIIPFEGGSVEVAALCRTHLPNTFIPVTDADICTKMFDKALAAKAFKQVGLPIPRTYSVLNAEMPVIAKPRKGTMSRGIKVYYNIENLMRLENLSDYLLQEYIEDFSEYTVDCYVNAKGEILLTVPRKRLEVTGGESTRTITVKEPRLEQLARETIKAFALRGPVTIQFLHDRTRDRYLLLEVNPRLGGGVMCSIYAGAPICDYLLRESMGIETTPCNDWNPGTLAARYWKEAIFYQRGENGQNN